MILAGDIGGTKTRLFFAAPAAFTRVATEEDRI